MLLSFSEYILGTVLLAVRKFLTSWRYLSVYRQHARNILEIQHGLQANILTDRGFIDNGVFLIAISLTPISGDS